MCTQSSSDHSQYLQYFTSSMQNASTLENRGDSTCQQEANPKIGRSNDLRPVTLTAGRSSKMLWKGCSTENK